MRLIKLFFGLCLMLSFQMNAQNTDNANEVGTYLESNGSLLQYEYAYDQLLQMLMKQFPKTAETANGWDYLEKNKSSAVAEMKQELIPIYQKNFTSNEIEKMTTFYQSETGQQLTKDRSKMTTTQKEYLNTFYNSDVGKKIIEKQPVLSKAIAAASESWSRDLYETALSLLKA